MTVLDIFAACSSAISKGKLIVRESAQDKEFHFQNWFKARLIETGFAFEQGGRNSYPDFRIVQATDGYEIKGLAYPGRDANFDSDYAFLRGHLIDHQTLPCFFDPANPNRSFLFRRPVASAALILIGVFVLLIAPIFVILARPSPTDLL